VGIIQEFKAFAIKGNMVDMAVGIIIGGAFGTIVQSLVKDIIMPPIGKVTGNIDFKDLTLSLGNDASDQAVTVNYGNFINNVISFLIVAFAVFMLVKGMNRLKREEEAKPAPPPPPSDEVRLLTEIRDALAK